MFRLFIGVPQIRPVLNQELTLSSNSYFFQIPSRLFSLESANTVRCMLNQEILVIIQKLVFYVFHQKHMNLSQNWFFMQFHGPGWFW